MLKPSGMLVYAVGPIAGAGGIAGVNISATPDLKGDVIDLARFPPGVDPLPRLVAFFVPTALGTAASNAGRCVVSKSFPMNALQVTVENFSPAGGDTVSGFIYCILVHGENLAL